MELLKLLFVFGLLWKAGDTTESENVSFSVERTWQNYRVIHEACTCRCEDDSWKEDIQEYYDGCYSATRDFRGDSYELADNVVKSLEEYFTKMIYFTNSNSTIVTKSATSIAKALAACKTLKSSSWNIIYQFDKVYPPISDEFNAIAENLRDHIGDLTDTFTNAVSDLKVVFSKYMRDFLGSPLGCGRNVDFKKVLKKLQKLMNTVALINETLLKKCDGEASQEVRESVMILDLLYFYKAIVVQGIYSCVLDVMYDRKCYIPLTFKTCSHSLNYAILTIGEAVNAVVFPLTKSLTALLRIVVDITMALNNTFKSVIGLVEGVETTVGSIVKNLLKGTQIKKSISDDRTNILKGLLRK